MNNWKKNTKKKKLKINFFEGMVNGKFVIHEWEWFCLIYG